MADDRILVYREIYIGCVLCFMSILYLSPYVCLYLISRKEEFQAIIMSSQQHEMEGS